MPRKSWWARLPFGVRMAAGASAVLVVVGAGIVGVATVMGGGGERPAPRIVTEVNQAAPSVPLPVKKPHPEKPRLVPKNQEKVDKRVVKPKSVVVSVTPTRAPILPTTPVQTVQTQIETREIPYETRVVHDPALPRGAQEVETPGVNGVETLRYLVTLTDGRPTGRKLIDAVVTRQPQHEVVALGTRKPAPGLRHPARNCGEALNFCVPLGRKAICPDNGRQEDAAIPLPDLVVSSDDLGYLEGVAC